MVQPQHIQRDIDAFKERNYLSPAQVATIEERARREMIDKYVPVLMRVLAELTFAQGFIDSVCEESHLPRPRSTQEAIDAIYEVLGVTERGHSEDRSNAHAP